jgi:hypothetical protein
MDLILIIIILVLLFGGGFGYHRWGYGGGIGIGGILLIVLILYLLLGRGGLWFSDVAAMKYRVWRSRAIGAAAVIRAVEAKRTPSRSETATTSKTESAAPPSGHRKVGPGRSSVAGREIDWAPP